MTVFISLYNYVHENPTWLNIHCGKKNFHNVYIFKVIFKLTELFIDILICKMKLQDGKCLKRVKKKPKQTTKLKVFQPPPKCFKANQLDSGFSHSSFLLLRLAHFSQVTIAPEQTRWFIVAIHLLYSSITSRLLGNHGSSCLLLSSTEGPSVSGGRWKALRTHCCHTK